MGSSLVKTLIACALLAFAISPALAALKVEDRAPDFNLPAILVGEEFTFHLADALKKGRLWRA
jgi:hypothetical protein